MRRFHLLNIGLHSQKRLQPGFVFLQQVRSDCHLVVNDFHNTVTNPVEKNCINLLELAIQ